MIRKRTIGLTGVVVLGLLSALLYFWTDHIFTPDFHRERAVLEKPVVPAGSSKLAFPKANPDKFKLIKKRMFPSKGFDFPVQMVQRPDSDSEYYVVEKPGKVKRVSTSSGEPVVSTFIDIRDRVYNRGGSGLLSIAFHPDYEINRRFYLFYSTNNPRKIVVTSFRGPEDPSTAVDKATEKVLLELDKSHHSHNGGMMTFGPDNMLYIGMGDAVKGLFDNSQAQDLSTLLGKMLRLDLSNPVEYAIPEDNPFVHTSGARAEIWAYGLRQPWRFSFDRLTGDIWLGEVGGDKYEEVNTISRGANYGWPFYEGLHRGHYKGINPLDWEATEPPVHEFPHPTARALIGGYVYRGDDIPWLYGKYLFGDATGGEIWSLTRGSDGTYRPAEVAYLESISSFSEDNAGNLYGLSGRKKIAPIYRFEAAPQLPGMAPFPEKLSRTGLFQDLAELQPTAGVIPYDVVSPLWSDGTRKRRWIALPGDQKITFSAGGAWQFPPGTVLIKHFDFPELSGSGYRRLETRVLVHETAGWAGYTYRWNKAQTDARLLKAAEVENLEFRDALGIKQTFEYNYPSGRQCKQCHRASAGHILGVHTAQLNFELDYTDGKANQLQVLSELGLFDDDLPALDRLPRLVDPADESQSLESRARSYLAANCSGCHLGDEIAGTMDLRYATPLAETYTVNFPTYKESGQEFVIHSGSRTKSEIWRRMTNPLMNKRMPPVGSSRIDDAGLWLIGRWISEVDADELELSY